MVESRLPKPLVAGSIPVSRSSPRDAFDPWRRFDRYPTVTLIPSDEDSPHRDAGRAGRLTTFGRSITAKGQLSATDHVIIEGTVEGDVVVPDHGVAVTRHRASPGKCLRPNRHRAGPDRWKPDRIEAHRASSVVRGQRKVVVTLSDHRGRGPASPVPVPSSPARPTWPWRLPDTGRRTREASRVRRTHPTESAARIPRSGAERGDGLATYPPGTRFARSLLGHVLQLLEREDLHGPCLPGGPSRPSSRRAGRDWARPSSPFEPAS